MEIHELIEKIVAFGLTQAEIADRADLTQPYVSQLAAGQRGSRVTVKTYDALKTLHDELVAASKKTGARHRAAERA